MLTLTCLSRVASTEERSLILRWLLVSKGIARAVRALAVTADSTSSLCQLQERHSHMSLLSGNFRVVGSNPYRRTQPPRYCFAALQQWPWYVIHPSSAVAQAFLRPRTLRASCGQVNPTIFIGWQFHRATNNRRYRRPEPTAHSPSSRLHSTRLRPREPAYAPILHPISKHPIPNFPRRTYQPRLIEA
jgi:hypothetical protein